MAWYLIKTSHRKTISAMDFYNSIGVVCYVPFYKVNLSATKEIRKPFLSGYIFVQFQNKINYDLVNLNPYTKDVIVVNSKPIEIPQSQMQIMINHVESIYNNDHFANVSKGDLFKVNHGKLQGVIGKVVEIRNNKIYLNIESLSAKLEIKYS
tara:strand:+ start:772 stop:1227 length:456 start_codon:yes stop_codon:yes gene_type:complete